MSRLTQLLHLDDGEFPALRAQIESKPLAPRPAPKPPNWGRDMIAFLNNEAPVERAADHHRYDPNRLLPRHAMVRRVNPARVVRDDIDTVTADVVAALQARPELRHEHALLVHLAPIVAWLKEVEL